MGKRSSFVILFLILGLSFFLRFWELEKRFIFSGEANASFYSLRDLFDGKWSVLLGLGAADYVQHLFHTPWYMYLMAPIFFFSKGDPLAFAIFHSLVGVVGTFILFRTGELIHSRKLGFIAAFVNAVWNIAIIEDRTVWAAGLIPFASILTLYLAVLAHKKKRSINFILLGAWLGISLSFHYQFVVTIGVVLLWTLIQHRKKFLFVFFPIIFSLLPLIVFDIRNGFYNTYGLWLVAKSLFENTRPCPTNYFLLQFQRPLILIVAAVLSRINWKGIIILLSMLAIIQLSQFFTYNATPSYAERKLLLEQVLQKYNNVPLEVYLRDGSSYEYRYLLDFLAKQHGIDPATIVTYEPWQRKNHASIVIVNRDGKDELLVR